MKNIFTCLILMVFFYCPLGLRAQGRPLKSDDKVARMEENRKTNTPFSILFKENSGYTSADIPQLFEKYLAVRSNTDMRSSNFFQNGNITVYKYQQFFMNIKVEHGSGTVTLKNGKVNAIIADFYNIGIATNIHPVLTESMTLNKALALVHANIYKWELPAEEQHLKRESNDPDATYLPKGELVLVEDFHTGTELNGQVMLAYKFDIYAHSPLSRTNVYVDAVSGKILFTDLIIKHANEPVSKKSATNLLSPLVTGTAASRYSGIVSMPTRLVTGSYRLQAAIATELYPLHTLNMLKGTNYGAATEFTDADNNWTAAEYNNVNMDNVALDAHWGAARVYDYWKTRHNRNSYNNANAVINSYVHFDVSYDNAYWDGIRMTYGDGTNISGGFSPLTSLDVCAHEIGHAVCQFTANLAYNRESGAMNEGFSDIWGAAVEHFADPFESDVLPKSHFLIGEEISIGSAALRSMSNPKAFGQPDTYLGINWQDASVAGCPAPGNGNDQCGVHTNSGVLNYWFYLLVSGKSGINDIGNPYVVPGIGWVDAEKIAYLTETSLTATSNYAACRTASINAASTLFGACSLQKEAVTRAWYAVNVGPDFIPCNPQIMFNGLTQTTIETGSAGISCLRTKTINVPVKITSAATQSATVSFTASGTAANGTAVDYIISPATVTFPGGSAVDQNLVITINNDAYVEGPETIILDINTVTTTGNATKGNIYQQYTINITDDDYAPQLASLSANQSLYSENFTAPGLWTVANSAGAAATWKLGSNVAGTDPYFGNGCAYVSINTASYTYNSTAGASRLQSPAINTLNKFNLQLTFDLVCMGEFSGGVYYDYGTLLYSTDGTNWLPVNAVKYQGYGVKTTITVPLPAGAENIASLKLGFRWDNDNSVENQPPLAIDNVVLRGDIRTPATVQSTINTTVSSDQQYLGPNATVHFYDRTSGNIMATIQNLNSFDYGCTTVEVDRSGNNTQYISGDVSANPKQRLSDKTFKVTPASNSPSGDYRITLYYTAAEKAGYESSSTRVWAADNGSNNGTRIAKHSGAISTMSTANAITPATVESAGIYGGDYTITAHFTNGFSGFAAGVPPLTLVPVTLLDWYAVKKGNDVLLSWKVAGQLNIRNYSVEHSTDGTFKSIGTVTTAGMNHDTYSYLHLQPVNGMNYYRLRITDNDGSYSYSGIAKIHFKAQTLITIKPNPVKKEFNILYGGITNVSSVTITDVKGRQLKKLQVSNNTGTIPVDVSELPPGLYILHLEGENNIKSSEKFIKE